MTPATAIRQSVIPPPASSQTSTPGTTYTPYIPRSKRASAISTVTAPASANVDREEKQVPRFSTSHGGGVTTRHLPPTQNQSPSEVVSAATAAARNAGPSAALLDKVRALDNLPRLGALKTLDLRGNDLRVRISWPGLGSKLTS
jgi:protein phosphatase 1 regulatory subunit 37